MKILTARYISVRLLQKKKLRLEISKYSKDNWQRTLSEIVHKYSNKRLWERNNQKKDFGVRNYQTRDCLVNNLFTAV